LLAAQLDAEFKIIKITPALRALRVYRLLPLSFFPGQKLKALAVAYGKKHFLSRTDGEFLSARLTATGGPWVARSNAYVSAKHRMRAVTLYKEAERNRGLVIGAANKTEWMTGTFTQWGCDHCADLMPLLHLYRSQLIPLAEHLGLPEDIIHKKADPDILPGLDDKGELLGSFKEADLILWGLENQIPLSDLEGRFGKEKVKYIQTLVDNSAYYRETPYSLL
jgi:NAD+ synthase